MRFYKNDGDDDEDDDDDDDGGGGGGGGDDGSINDASTTRPVRRCKRRAVRVIRSCTYWIVDTQSPGHRG